MRLLSVALLVCVFIAAESHRHSRTHRRSSHKRLIHSSNFVGDQTPSRTYRPVDGNCPGAEQLRERILEQVWGSCAVLCDKKKGCLGFSFNAQNDKCELRGKCSNDMAIDRDSEFIFWEMVSNAADSNPEKGYIRDERGNCPGNLLYADSPSIQMGYRRSSQTQCEASCSARPECVGFSYISTDRIVGLKESQYQCMLKDRLCLDDEFKSGATYDFYARQRYL